MFNMTEKLEEHRIMKAALAELKQEEMDLRVEICMELGIDGLQAGTHSFEWPSAGMAAKMAKKLNYRFDQDLLDEELLTDDERDCIKWKPELSVAKYKKLANADGLNVSLIVTTGAPTLEVTLEDFS